VPYTVIADANGCSGYAVVKEGEKTPIPGGCHTLKSDAIAHMVAVEAAYRDGETVYEEEMEESAVRDGEELLTPRQKALYEVYESITEAFGMFTQDIGANGAHYVAESPFKEEGMICANCVFYEGGRGCEIVEGDIAPNGICKLWIINEEILGVSSPATEPEPEDDVEEEPMEYEARQEPNMVAPAFMRMSARRGLRLHEEGYSGEGLKPQTVEDARKMAAGEALSEQKWRKIAPWIARHIVDLDAVQGDEITAGLVAMLLWGGGSSKSSARRAQAYAERIISQLDEGTRNAEEIVYDGEPHDD
jgi:hypothetical protein